MRASRNNNQEVVTCLVEAKAKLNLQDKVPSFPRDDEYSAMNMDDGDKKNEGDYNEYGV